MGQLRRLRDQLRRRPLVADALLGLMLITLFLGLNLPVFFSLATQTNAGDPAPADLWLLILMVIACLSLALRRAYPYPVWAVITLCAVVITAIENEPTEILLPLCFALYTLGARTRLRSAIVAAVATALALLAVQVPESGWITGELLEMPVWVGLATAIGVAVKFQRRAIEEARQRALAAEASREEEAQRRVADERIRIARELHDVIAHHVSVISVQAGVAEHLLDSDPQKARDALAHVRLSSRDVLVEMNQLLGVLRTDEDDGRHPARGLAQLDDLIESWRRIEMPISVHQIGEPSPLAPLVDVTAYRVIEEALTNAHKYGSGSTSLTIEWKSSTMILRVTNAVVQARASTSQTGRGLTGMKERVTAVGGHLQTGLSEQRAVADYVVTAELPASIIEPALQRGDST
ncbi:UNVERIFIED_CONTAM: histidine kinase [Microbacterium sp. SLM126]